ncbi:ap-3 adaptor complex subunit [Grosmannia clavigera kw1407]|uniref:Ap-3 adaptor complex subunit n=1 Tax=Grosmannia clavigera (strain kw1407 / UAMH 11150) TaxID=655863 RepID=F0XSK3_GROCL|nr:ap-3 adaptor complex subunit [Grosmannia clavigera kw1407]EFW99285.1 ap-3 adaptor complex subunit [Grosmannia clavigera kw1407]
MDGVIEALHIYDEHNKPVLSHAYTARPLSAAQLLPLYLDRLQQLSGGLSSSQAATSTSSSTRSPPPGLVYVPATTPPTLVFAISHGPLLLLLTTTSELEPLLALEFLHRVADALEDFLGSPLTAARIEASYDVAAQLLTEMCDAGAVGTTEGNALHDLVEVEGLVGKLLGSISLPGKAAAALSAATSAATSAASSSASPSLLPSSLSSLSSASSPALPWRRANVRHTSNELYADVVESLAVTLAPSGRPLAAFAHGSIAFTAKISGLPDVLLTLSDARLLDLPVFHPCVRLARWREHPGHLSFVPPDGRFVLAAYEVDLMAGAVPGQTPLNPLRLPVTVDMRTSLGPVGADFDLRVHVNRSFATGTGGSGNGNHGSAGTPASPLLQDVHITVPLPAGIRNLAEVRPTKGDAAYNPGDRFLAWHIAARDIAAGTTYFGLRCTVVGHDSGPDDPEDDNNNAGLGPDGGDEFGFRTTASYDDGADGDDTINEGAYQTPAQTKKKKKKRAAAKAAKAEMAEKAAASARDEKEAQDAKDEAAAAAAKRRRDRNRMLMPASAAVSFSVKGWLASGVRIDSIVLDPRRSRGLGEGVKPFKGVKYLTISKGGVELRC